MAALVAVLALCLAGISAVAVQVRCVDAAREAARLAARGDEQTAIGVARQIAPAAAAVQVRRDGRFVVVEVTARPNLLPALVITGTGVAAVEPSG